MPRKTKGSATVKQTQVFHKVWKEGKDVSQAIREVGLSESYAKNPHLMTRSDGWLTLMEQYGLGNDTLLQRHKELLASDNEKVAVKALDIGYKVSGKYQNAGTGTHFNAPVQIVINPIEKPPRKDTA